MKKDNQSRLKTAIALVIISDILVWSAIFYSSGSGSPEIYFLDVGQGDSSLVIFGDGANMLIDGGPMNGRVGKNLEMMLPAADRRIDLVMISHPQLDHFGGLLEVMENYDVGAVLSPPVEGESEFWEEFERIRKSKGVPRISINEGDRIVYGSSEFSVLSPSTGFVKDINDVSIAGILKFPGLKVFFGGDMGFEKEADILRKYDVDVDILKVSHHGSKYSSGSGFLKEASPSVSIIEVGKNSYGHPTKEALSRIAGAGSEIFRTDLSGFVKVSVENGKLQVYTQK